MNIENIRCFITLAEYLNFTRAAEKEHITQTAMSRKISALEKELGVVLLYRDTRQVKLTVAGGEFYGKAKELIKLYDTTIKLVQDTQNDFSEELKIGIGVYDHVLLNRFLGFYLSKIPEKVKINCLQEPYPALAKDFEERLIDIMISTEQFEEEIRETNPTQLGIIPITDDPWYLVLHKDNPLAKYDVVPMERLANETLLTMNAGGVESVKKIFRDYFPFKDVMVVNSFDSKLVMANANLGFAWAPSFVFPVADRYQNIVLRTTDPPYNIRRFSAYYWKDNRSPVVCSFVECFKKFCELEKTTLKNKKL